MTVEQIINLTMDNHNFDALLTEEEDCCCFQYNLSPYRHCDGEFAKCRLALSGSEVENGDIEVAYPIFCNIITVKVVIDAYLYDKGMYGLCNNDNGCNCKAFELRDCIQLGCKTIRDSPYVEHNK